MIYVGTTSVFHDTEVKTDVTSCADPGCYTKQIKYNATQRQMAMLADISGSCKQFFRVYLIVDFLNYFIIYILCL